MTNSVLQVPAVEPRAVPVRPLLKTIMRLGTPSVLESLLTSGLLLTDTLMLAQLTNNRLFLAASAIASVMFWRLVSMTGSTQIGAGAYVARRWGEEKFHEAGRAVSHVVMMGAMIGFFVALVMYPLAPKVFGLMTSDAEVIAVASGYMRILLLVFPARLALLNMTSCMRASGDTVSPLLIMVGMVAANIALNWILIFGNLGAPRLEMNGAAVATTLVFMMGFVAAFTMLKRGVRPRRIVPANTGVPINYEVDTDIDLAHYQPLTGKGADGVLQLQRPGFRFWIPDITPSILRVSRSALGEEILYSIGFLTFIGMVGRFGTEVLAAHSATVRIESMSFTAGWGVAVATSTMVGQALGAGQLALAKRLFSLNAAVAMSMMAFMGLLFAAFPEWFLGWFDLDPAVMSVAVMLMFIIGIEQPLMGMAMTLSGGLRGSGETFGPFVTQIFGVIGTRLGIGYLLAWPLGMGVAGIYWATALDWLLRSAVLLFFVLRGNWQRVKV